MARRDRQVFRIYAGLGGVIALVFALVGVAFVSVSQLAEALEQNIVTHDAVQAVEDVQSSTETIYAGYVGYMTVGYDESLALMTIGQRGFAAGIERLREATTSGEQEARIVEAEQILEEWRTEHVEPGLALRRQYGSEGLPADSLEARGARGEVYVERMQGVLETLAASERAVLAQRAERVRLLERWTKWLLGLGGVFGLIGTAAFARLGVLRSRELLAANRRLSAEVVERQRAQAEVARGSRRNSLILEAAGEGICGLDASGCITFLNPAAEEMLGTTEGEMYGESGHAAMHHSRPDGSAFPADECPIFTSLRDGRVHLTREDVFWRRDGTSFPVEYITRPILEDGTVTGMVLTFRDITERREVERLRDEFVSIDFLTGVPNRRKSTELIEQLRERADRDAQPLAFGIVDLDRFKGINDGHGHACGDRVLQEVARFLVGTFGPDDVVGRWGGEEFVLAMYGRTREEATEKLTQALESLRAKPTVDSDGDRLVVSFSGGVAEYPADGADLQALYRAADAALYEAKAAGRALIRPAKPFGSASADVAAD